MNTKQMGIILASMVGTVFSTATFATQAAQTPEDPILIAGGNSCNTPNSCNAAHKEALSKTANAPHQSHHGSVKCHGANACKGQSACKTAHHECKGQNSCKGKGFLFTKSEKDCHHQGGKTQSE